MWASMAGESSGRSKRFRKARWTAITIGLIVVGGLIIRWIPPFADMHWSTPTLISQIESRHGSAFSLHRWNGTVVGRRPGGIFYFLSEAGKWKERFFEGFENGSCYPVIIDAHGPNAVFCNLEYPHKKAKPIIN